MRGKSTRCSAKRVDDDYYAYGTPATHNRDLNVSPGFIPEPNCVWHYAPTHDISPHYTRLISCDGGVPGAFLSSIPTETRGALPPVCWVMILSSLPSAASPQIHQY